MPGGEDVYAGTEYRRIVSVEDAIQVGSTGKAEHAEEPASTSCSNRFALIETAREGPGAVTQQIVAAVSRRSSGSVLPQEKGASGGQQSPSSAAIEQASAGHAAPRRPTDTTSNAINRRSTNIPSSGRSGKPRIVPRFSHWMVASQPLRVCQFTFARVSMLRRTGWLRFPARK